MDEWTLRGREDVLARVQAVIDPDRSGPPFGALLVGEAGVGKSRIAREVAAAAATSGCRVELVAATHALRRVPMAAVAHLLPDGLPPTAQLLQTAVSMLAARRGGSPTLLVVDDVHLLDGFSLALVTQAVASGRVRALVTVRAEQAMRPSVIRSWTDGHLLREEVYPLDGASVAALLDEQLGPAEDAIRDEVVRLVGGNALLLRELLRDAVTTRSIRREQGTWRLAGSLVSGPGVRDLVAARSAQLDRPAARALQLLALAAPVRLEVLVEAAGAEACRTLELSGLLRRSELDGTEVTVSQPLVAEVVTARIGPVLERELLGRLVEALAPRRTTASDSLRAATWAAASGVDVPADLLVEAAEVALARGDADAAVAFAAAACRKGPSMRAVLVHGRALATADRLDEADAVLALAPTADDADRARVLSVRAHVLGFLGRAPQRAAETLRCGLSTIQDAEAAAWVRSELAMQAAMHGGFDLAITEARAALEVLTDDRMRLATLAVSSLAHAMRGEPKLAETAVVEAERVAAGLGRPADPFLDRLVANRCFALHDLLAVDAAQEAAVTALQAVARGGAGDPLMLSMLGIAAGVWTGDVVGALRRADRVGPGPDVYGIVPVAPAYRALALGHLGQFVSAREALARVGPLDPGGPRARIWRDRAAGWLVWWEEDHDRGLELLTDGVARSGAAGHTSLALQAVEDILRLGAPAAALTALDDLGAPASPYLRLLEDACHAMECGDHAALDEVAATAACAGLRPLAIDLWWAAAAAAADEGSPDDPGVRRLAARAQLQSVVLDDDRPSALAERGAATAVQGLSPRGVEVALLTMAQGLSAAEVGRRLGLSRRTVEGHRAAVYAALDVHSVDALGDALAVATTRPRTIGPRG